MLATKQDYYDLLVRSALDGTMPSYDVEKDKCYYRGPGGTKCAVGVGIPDEEYNRDMECYSARMMPGNLSSFFPDMRKDDLSDIQEIHDESCRALLMEEDPDRYQLGFAREFVRRINDLPCFSNVRQVDPRTFSAASLSNVTSPAM